MIKSYIQWYGINLKLKYGIWELSCHEQCPENQLLATILNGMIKHLSWRFTSQSTFFPSYQEDSWVESVLQSSWSRTQLSASSESGTSNPLILISSHWRSSHYPVSYVYNNKNSNIQGRSLYVVKVIFHSIRNCSWRKEIAPSGSYFFPLREVPILKRDANEENDCLIQ